LSRDCPAGAIRRTFTETRSLPSTFRQHVLTIARGAIEAASPHHLIHRTIADPDISARLSGRPLRVVAVGKAAPFMAASFARTATSRIREAIVIGTHLPIELPKPFEWIPSSHPLPDERSVTAGRRALEVARRTATDEVLVVLLSGGASALMAVPAGDLTLGDKRTAVDALLKAGADITALNTIRKHLSAVKGGRLAAAASGATVCFAISDVVGDDLSVIGSGPTVPDPSTFRDAWNYVQRFGVENLLTAPAIAYLRAGLEGKAEETPSPGDPRLERSITRVIGGRFNAMNGAAEAARSLGYDVITIDEPVVGEAKKMGPAMLNMARALAEGKTRPLAVMASGETTVKVVGSGKGGRNQELALSVVNALADETNDVALASIGTDGIDGPTDAAGAYADTTTLTRAKRQSLDPASYLSDNNAYAFFQQLGDLIITGPSTTNVGDLQVVLFR
jgi:hydroxypyruvate reductase